MDSYRSKVSPITLIVNALLCIIVIVLMSVKNPEYLYLAIIVVVINIIVLTYRFLKPIYFFDINGLEIVDKRKKYLVYYNDIKYIEKDSSEIGMLCGYGFKRLLVSTGRGNSQNYLITPVNEETFIMELEKRIEIAKKDTK